MEDSSKKVLINSIKFAKEMIEDEAKVQHDDFFTFSTNFGFIVGKIKKIVKIKGDTEEELEKNMKSLVKEKVIDVYSMSNSMLEHIKIKDINNNAIQLEDVIIYNYTNLKDSIESNAYTIFTDQIVGIIPGKFNFKKE